MKKNLNKIISLTVLFLLVFQICVSSSFAVKVNCKKIETFKDIKNSGKCNTKKGFEIHHLIEKRFAELLGLNANLIPSICLSKEAHKVFTNRWRKTIPYKGDYSDIAISTILKAILLVYKDNPCIIKELTKYLAKTLKGKYAKFAKRFLKTGSKILKILERTTIPLIAIGIGYEICETFAMLDDNFHGDKYVAKSIEISMEAIELYSERDEKSAIEKLGQAYFYLGYAVYHRMVPYKSGFKKELLDSVANKSQELAEMAIPLFKKSIEFKNDNPFAYYFLGDTYFAMSDFNSAKENFVTAQRLFNQEGKNDWIDMVKKKMAIIERKLNEREE